MCKKNCGCTGFWSLVSKHSFPGSGGMILLFFQLSFGNAGRTSSGGFPMFVSLVLSEEMFHNLKMSHP